MLAAIQEWEDALTLHVEDSLTLLPLIDELVKADSQTAVLDVGSGAGFPGFALALVRNRWQVSCAELLACILMLLAYMMRW